MCSNQKGRQLSAFLLLPPLRNVELPEIVVLPGNVEPPGNVVLPGNVEPPLGTSSTSSMVRTTLPSQPLTSEQIQPPARTRPLPVLSPLHQPRRYRIGMNVVHCRSQMTLIADIAIPITSHPDAAA